MGAYYLLPLCSDFFFYYSFLFLDKMNQGLCFVISTDWPFFFFLIPDKESLKFGVCIAIKLASFLLSANTVSKVLKKTTRIEYCLIILYISFNRVSIHQGQ